MERLATLPVAGRVALVAMSDRTDGDLSCQRGKETVASARESLAAGSSSIWSQPRQVHSDRVLVVDAPGANDGAVGDALATDAIDALLAIQVADCVPIALVNPSGSLGVVHAGWRGAFLGVIEATVRSLRAIIADGGARFPIQAVVGPHICSACYAFGLPELEMMVRRFGPSVAATTNDGQPALDMTSVVSTELERLDVEIAAIGGGCTAHNGDMWWSHRARRDGQRQILVATMTDDVDRWEKVFPNGY